MRMMLASGGSGRFRLGQGTVQSCPGVSPGCLSSQVWGDLVFPDTVRLTGMELGGAHSVRLYARLCEYPLCLDKTLPVSRLLNGNSACWYHGNSDGMLPALLTASCIRTDASVQPCMSAYMRACSYVCLCASVCMSVCMHGCMPTYLPVNKSECSDLFAAIQFSCYGCLYAGLYVCDFLGDGYASSRPTCLPEWRIRTCRWLTVGVFT